MGKHTPGPWIVFVAEHEFHILPAGRPGEVAQCSKSPNADLISAAPDMLSALIKLVGFCDAQSENETDWERSVTEARAVIAKASGHIVSPDLEILRRHGRGR